MFMMAYSSWVLTEFCMKWMKKTTRSASEQTLRTATFTNNANSEVWNDWLLKVIFVFQCKVMKTIQQFCYNTFTVSSLIIKFFFFNFTKENWLYFDVTFTVLGYAQIQDNHRSFLTKIQRNLVLFEHLVCHFIYLADSKN